MGVPKGVKEAVYRGMDEWLVTKFSVELIYSPDPVTSLSHIRLRSSTYILFTQLCHLRCYIQKFPKCKEFPGKLLNICHCIINFIWVLLHSHPHRLVHLLIFVFHSIHQVLRHKIAFINTNMFQLILSCTTFNPLLVHNVDL